MQQHLETNQGLREKPAHFLRNVAALVTGHPNNPSSAGRLHRHPLKQNTFNTNIIFGKHPSRPRRHTFSLHREDPLPLTSSWKPDNPDSSQPPFPELKRVISDPEKSSKSEEPTHTQRRRSHSFSSPLLDRLRYVDEVEAQELPDVVVERHINEAVIEERPSLEDEAALNDRYSEGGGPRFPSPPLLKGNDGERKGKERIYWLEVVDEEDSLRGSQGMDGAIDVLTVWDSDVSGFA